MKFYPTSCVHQHVFLVAWVWPIVFFLNCQIVKLLRSHKKPDFGLRQVQLRTKSNSGGKSLPSRRLKRSSEPKAMQPEQRRSNTVPGTHALSPTGRNMQHDCCRAVSTSFATSFGVPFEVFHPIWLHPEASFHGFNLQSFNLRQRSTVLLRSFES